MAHLKDLALFIASFFAGDPAIEKRKKELEDMEIDVKDEKGSAAGDGGANNVVTLKWFAPKPKNND